MLDLNKMLEEATANITRGNPSRVSVILWECPYAAVTIDKVSNGWVAKIDGISSISTIRGGDDLGDLEGIVRSLGVVPKSDLVKKLNQGGDWVVQSTQVGFLMSHEIKTKWEVS